MFGLWGQDRDILRFMFLDAPYVGGGCCICNAHAPKTSEAWSGKVLSIAGGIRVSDNTGLVTAPKTYAPLAVGAEQISFYVEGNQPGGWNRDHYLIYEVGPADDKDTITNYYINARAKVWAKTDNTGNVTDDKHRLTWNPTNIVEVRLTPPDSNETTPLGMEIRAGNHSKGHAYLQLVGDGHFRVTGPGGMSFTNGQTHAWAATRDGMDELTVQCYSVGSATLRLCYTNANVSGVSYRSSIKLKGTRSLPSIVFRKGNNTLSRFMGETYTHGGIDWGVKVTDIYTDGPRNITLTEFYDEASDPNLKLRVRFKDQNYMSQRILEKNS